MNALQELIDNSEPADGRPGYVQIREGDRELVLERRPRSAIQRSISWYEIGATGERIQHREEFASVTIEGVEFRLDEPLNFEDYQEMPGD